MHTRLKSIALAVCATAFVSYTFTATAQTARDILGPAAVVPLASQPTPRIIIDPPLAEPLSHGLVVIQYRTENLHLTPVFGLAALAVSPRVGHVHVSLDDAPWVWVDASGEPVILNGLPPGPHKVLIQLASANHQPLDQGAVKFTVPAARIAAPGATPVAAEIQSTTTVQPLPKEPPAKIIIDLPLADALSRGVVIIQYRTENLHIMPVYGPAALGVTPRVGHIHVTVDDAMALGGCQRKSDHYQWPRSRTAQDPHPTRERQPSSH